MRASATQRAKAPLYSRELQQGPDQCCRLHQPRFDLQLLTMLVGLAEVEWEPPLPMEPSIPVVWRRLDCTLPGPP